MKKKFSIITVVYNSVTTIEKTINSVLNQTYDNVEYIIIDGNSTDGTLDILKKYSERIDVMVSEPDSGIYDAMNKGIRLAQGDVIAFLNSDDWYEKDTVNNAAQILCNSDEYDMVCGKIILECEGRDKEEVQSNISGDFWFGNIIMHPTLFSKKRVFDRVGFFDCNYRIAADYKWMSKALLLDYKVAFSDKILTHFSLGGISTNNDLKTIEESYKVVNELMLQSDVDKEKRNKIIAHWENRKKMCIARYDIINHPYKFFDVIGKDNDNQLPIIIWGTGFYGKFLSDIFKKNNKAIAGFIDSDPSKNGTIIDGIIVDTPSLLNCGNWYIIVAIDRSEELLKDIIDEIINNNDQYITIRDICDKIYANSLLI